MTGDSLAYPRRERHRDRWCGRRDGRRRHPGYNDLVEMAADATVTAPHPRHLIEQSLYRIEGERLAFEQRAAGDRATLATLRADLLAANVGLDKKSAAVIAAEKELTEAELLPRNYVELAPENRVKLLARRDDARNQRIAAARGDEAAQFAALNAVNTRIAAVKERITKEFVIAQVQARRVGAHCAMRVTTYWQNVVLLHPEGPYLVPLLRFTAQVLPSWVTAPADGDPAGLGRGPFELHRVVQRLDPKEST
ncbi:hypothetical protein [Actinocrispum wychmicini]|uniref:Uncharacterized protein n=1 Tax=Actinocrispum wychmicini TaxID=1213861 RepID=A0A4R2J3A8_9PSEU|nr:hypothetical protein [Actinocrispum wychmicini]TCO52913.1 hypothetical protein EV192_111107 [Actinocrispum wychmicini]